MALDNRVAWDPNENVGRSSAGTFKVRPHSKGKKFIIEFELKKTEPDPALKTNLTRLLDTRYNCIQDAILACQTASDNVCKRCTGQAEGSGRKARRGREQDADEQRESKPSESKRSGRKGKRKNKGKGKNKPKPEAAAPPAAKPAKKKASKRASKKTTGKKNTTPATPATATPPTAPRKRGRPPGSKDSKPRQKRSGAAKETAATPVASGNGKAGKKVAKAGRKPASAKADDVQQARDALREIGKDFDVD